MNASRMARMAGGLSSVMGPKRRDPVRALEQELRQPRTPVEHAGSSFDASSRNLATRGQQQNDSIG